MKSNVKDMTVGNPTKLLLTFMLPMVVGNIFQQFYSMVDSMIVGKFVGADALASVGATASVNFMIFSLCSGLSNGIGISISQYFGAGDGDKVKRAIANSVYIMFAAAAIMATIGITLSKPLLRLLNTPANIIETSTMYMRIMSVGIFAIALYNCIASILRALGDSKTPLYFLIVSSVLNVCLDLLFVRVFGFGVAGAGVATIISQFTSGCGSLMFAKIKNPYFKIEKAHRKPDMSIIQPCVRMGLPLAFQMSLISISMVILQSVVNSFGSVVVAAYTATSRIEQLIQQPFASLGMAMSTYTGQNIGAREIKRVKQGFIKGMMIMVIFSLLMLPIMQFVGHAIMSLFVNETDVIALGTHALKLTSWFYILLGSIYVCRGTLNGAGDATFAFINGVVEVIGRIGFAKPLTFIPMIGVWGVWLATAFTWGITGIVAIIRYAIGKWNPEKNPKAAQRLSSGTR